MKKSYFELSQEFQREYYGSLVQYAPDDLELSARYLEILSGLLEEAESEDAAGLILGEVAGSMAVLCSHEVHREAVESVLERWITMNPEQGPGCIYSVSTLIQCGYSDYAYRLMCAADKRYEFTQEELRRAFQVQRQIVPRMMAAASVGGEVLREEIPRFLEMMATGPSLKMQLNELTPYKEAIMEAAADMGDTVTLRLDACIPPRSERLQRLVQGEEKFGGEGVAE